VGGVACLNMRACRNMIPASGVQLRDLAGGSIRLFVHAVLFPEKRTAAAIIKTCCGAALPAAQLSQLAQPRNFATTTTAVARLPSLGQYR
jgi:hypothetical protein